MEQHELRVYSPVLNKIKPQLCFFLKNFSSYESRPANQRVYLDEVDQFGNLLHRPIQNKTPARDKLVVYLL